MKYVAVVFFLLLAYVLIFRTEDIKKYNWAIRHGVDEEGEKQQILSMKLVGAVCVITAVLLVILW